MDAVTLLDRARAAGLDVRLDGDRLQVRGPRGVEALIERLREHKAEIIALLRAEAAPKVCSWSGCGQPVGPWEADPLRPGLMIQKCAHHHHQRQGDGKYWRPIATEGACQPGLIPTEGEGRR